MTLFNRAEPVAAKRREEMFVVQDDGVTPAAATTVFTGKKASRKLAGKSTQFASATIVWDTVGVGGNAKTIAFVADGPGSGSVTNSGDAYTLHFNPAVTTLSNAVARLVSAGFAVTGSYVPSNTLATPADVFSAAAFAGGEDASLFVRKPDASDYLAALGVWSTITKLGAARDGLFRYEYMQAELDAAGSQVSVMVDKVPDAAFLDLATKTTHCDTIIYDKVASGANGNVDGSDPVTIAFLNDGTGAGTLNNSSAAWTFHYQSTVTTVADFEAAIVASSRFAIKAYGTSTNVLSHSADTFTATNMAGGVSYKRPQTYPGSMVDGPTGLVEGSYTRDDLLRLCAAALLSKVSDFTTGTLVFRDLGDSKNRFTTTRTLLGRTGLVINDPT